MSAKMITLRSDDLLDERLATVVAELQASGETQATRSSVVRAILYEHLQVPAEAAATREATRMVHRALREATKRCIDDVSEKLPTYLEEALAEAPSEEAS